MISGPSFLAFFDMAIENITAKNDIRIVIMSAYDTIQSGAPSLAGSSDGADMLRRLPSGGAHLGRQMGGQFLLHDLRVIARLNSDDAAEDDLLGDCFLLAADR